MTPPARSAAGKIVPKERAAALTAAWRARGDRVVMAHGVFDLLDVGHARQLAAARALGARLVVGVHGDVAATAVAGASRPVLAANERMALVAALRVVDLVVLVEDRSAEAWIAVVRPHVHAIGHVPGSESEREREATRAVGGETVTVGARVRPAGGDLIERVRARYARG